MTEDDVPRLAGPSGPWPAGTPDAAPRTTLVLGFDRDRASDAALTAAVDLAGRLQAHLAVVHVVGLGDFPVDPDAPDWEDEARATLAEERARVEGALSAHRYGWSYEVHPGTPVDVLVRSPSTGRLRHRRRPARTRDQRGAEAVIDGSVSRRLPATCGRPVLVVPVDGPVP